METFIPPTLTCNSRDASSSKTQENAEPFIKKPNLQAAASLTQTEPINKSLHQFSIASYSIDKKTILSLTQSSDPIAKAGADILRPIILKHKDFFEGNSIQSAKGAMWLLNASTPSANRVGHQIMSHISPYTQLEAVKETIAQHFEPRILPYMDLEFEFCKKTVRSIIENPDVHTRIKTHVIKDFISFTLTLPETFHTEKQKLVYAAAAICESLIIRPELIEKERIQLIEYLYTHIQHSYCMLIRFHEYYYDRIKNGDDNTAILNLETTLKLMIVRNLLEDSPYGALL